MKYFHLIKWQEGNREEHFKLVSRVSSCWTKIGYLIGLTSNELENYKRETLANQTKCWEKVMQKWLDGQDHFHTPSPGMACTSCCRISICRKLLRIWRRLCKKQASETGKCKSMSGWIHAAIMFINHAKIFFSMITPFPISCA